MSEVNSNNLPEQDPVFKMHLAAMREMQEPRDGVHPTPVSYLVACFIYILWGGFYIGYYWGNWSGNGLAERPVAGGVPTKGPPQDPMKLGKEVFNNCMQCHQESGLGVAGSYPPLVGSEHVLGDKRKLAALVLNGLSGDFTVKGVNFNGTMPPWATLEDEEIAAVLTYIRNSWGNKADNVPIDFVTSVRKEADGKGEWKAAALEAFAASKPPAPAAAPAAAPPAATAAPAAVPPAK